MQPEQHDFSNDELIGRELFDASWYARKYGPHVDEVSGWEHYRKIGRFEGKMPNPLFDPTWYCREYEVGPLPDALAHFAIAGVGQQHSPGPLFESEWYLRRHPDVAAAGIAPLTHFLNWGRHEGRASTTWCEDVRDAGIARDLTLPKDFALGDLVGYFSNYYVADRLVLQPDALALFDRAAPRWVFGRLPDRIVHQARFDQAIVIGGRREILVNGDIYTATSELRSEGSHRAFAVTFAVSPVISSAIHALDMAPEALEGYVPGDDNGKPMACVVDANLSRTQRKLLEDRIDPVVECVSIRRGMLCKIDRLRVLAPTPSPTDACRNAVTPPITKSRGLGFIQRLIGKF